MAWGRRATTENFLEPLQAYTWAERLHVGESQHGWRHRCRGVWRSQIPPWVWMVTWHWARRSSNCWATAQKSTGSWSGRRIRATSVRDWWRRRWGAFPKANRWLTILPLQTCGRGEEKAKGGPRSKRRGFIWELHVTRLHSWSKWVRRLVRESSNERRWWHR